MTNDDNVRSALKRAWLRGHKAAAATMQTGQQPLLLGIPIAENEIDMDIDDLVFKINLSEVKDV